MVNTRGGYPAYLGCAMSLIQHPSRTTMPEMRTRILDEGIAIGIERMKVVATARTGTRTSDSILTVPQIAMHDALQTKQRPFRSEIPRVCCPNIL